MTHNLRHFRGLEKWGIESVNPSDFLNLFQYSLCQRSAHATRSFLANLSGAAKLRAASVTSLISSRELAKRVERGPGSELAPVLRARGAGDTAHVIGGRREIDGQDLPLEQAIDSALADPSGVVLSRIPGRLALYMQEFPPGDTFILSYKP